jgi:type VI secretion system protein ImpC
MSENPQAQSQTGKQMQENVESFLAASLKETERLAGSLDATAEDAKRIVDALARGVARGIVKWDKDAYRTVKKAIEGIDQVVSEQLAAVMHHPKFTQLEGTWRGLHHLVMNSETGTSLKLKVLNVSKKEMGKDLEKAVEFDQSLLFKKLYEDGFGIAGGEPYGALIGDYYFKNHPEDIEFLTKISGVAAAAFCPFISAADPGLVGLQGWDDLSKPRDLAKIFDQTEYAQWKSFRDSDDSRFVALTMPRALARLPYGKNTKTIDEFAYEEAPFDKAGRPKAMDHQHYCWMNAAYVYGARLTDAFAKTGFCTTIQGRENGGLVEGLPTHVFKTDDGDTDIKCPTEIAITDRRWAELAKLGLLSLCHYKNTDYAVFFEAATAQKPKVYDDDDATANAELSACLPYIMAVSRFSHYLKQIARDKIGSFMEASDCEKWLDRWIHRYVTADANPTPEVKAQYPLAEAKVEVIADAKSPGSYKATFWLRPWLIMKQLRSSMRLVTRLPKKG